MAFLLPMAELVLEGMAVGTGSHIANDLMNQFVPKIKDLASDELGKKIGGIAQENPNGFVANTLNKSYQYSRLTREQSHKSNSMKRSGHRRTR